ncbi:hypothetical protein MIND_00389700 [Mycena indigotica]|uniref:Uncharacterized protein n=1 Tax=Mycena indigotica TaxID=2126181 RepID=A0A8H6T379_9AGAR|nr:uncharacterized protein MIND_00389700 [Mycena indigotica]KAF7310163.1 hypothetical protein MIND_00389700 [Mycena indigotica]
MLAAWTRVAPGCRRRALQTLPLRAYSVSLALRHPLRLPATTGIAPAPTKSKGASMRRGYAEVRDVKARLEEEGLPLKNSGPTTAALLAYADAYWLPPTDVPEGWSTDWKSWDYLLTLFAYSPYFLRLPQIEMLVNIRYAVPGEVKPVMYSADHAGLVFAVDREDAEAEADPEYEGAAEVYYLNCRTFSLYMFDPDHAPHVPPPQTIDELLMLIGTAPGAPEEAIPLLALEPDEHGQAVLNRILNRDASVIPVLEKEFLSYAPKATTPEEEMIRADELDGARRQMLKEAIQKAREFIRETEEELEHEVEESVAVRAQTSGEGGIGGAVEEEEERAFLLMRAALEEAKGKLKQLEEEWHKAYGVDKNV